MADAYPTENWDGGCAGFAYLVCRLTGTVRRAYPSATDARLASQIVSADMSAAPAGAFHHWSYFARLSGVYKDWGHVALAIGDGRAVMTNPEADEWDWGICLGETDVASWTARRRGIVAYVGWSYTYGENTATITTTQTAATASKPFTPQTEPEPEPTGVLPMPNISIIYNLDAPGQQQQVAIGPRGRVALNGQTADLLNRWMRWQIAGGDVSKAGGMSVAEMDLLISGVLSKIS
ncbi:hypothetical protein CEP17_14770 [Microbacterium sp. PM5]|nr:hypothetical protein CEP17_14770 [Microbacterium sp. PM5]